MAFVRQTRRLKWNRRLLMLLLEELYVSEEFEELLGLVEDLPTCAYPQAVAVAIALRHSWRPDDLRQVADLLGVPRRIAVHRKSPRAR